MCTVSSFNASAIEESIDEEVIKEVEENVTQVEDVADKTFDEEVTKESEEVKNEEVTKEVEEVEDEEVEDENEEEYKDYIVEYSEEYSTIWRVGYDDGYEGIKRDISNESEEYIKAYEDGYSEGEYDFKNNMHIDEDMAEGDRLEQAEKIIKDTMQQGYEGSYSVSIVDIGVMIVLDVEEFTESEHINALDVDQAMNKALRVNGYEDIKVATVVSDVHTNEVYLTLVDGEIMYKK
jgi:hypothetical protein